MINPFFLITLSFPGLIVQIILRGFQSRSNIFFISSWCFVCFFFWCTLQTEDAGGRPTGHYDEFGFMVDGGKFFQWHHGLLLCSLKLRDSSGQVVGTCTT